MIITDLNGVKYNLLKDKLVTTKGAYGFFVIFKDIKEHALQSAQLYLGNFGVDKEHALQSAQLYLGNFGVDNYIRVAFGRNKIGCRTFSSKTFARILKAVKESK
jgi:hypothetical protein